MFGLVLLRMLSFNLELHKNSSNYDKQFEKIQHGNEIDKNEKKTKPKQQDSHLASSEAEYLKALSNGSLSMKEFNLLNYLVYIFYAPVYFSGPTILFNSFIIQINNNFTVDKDKETDTNFSGNPEQTPNGPRTNEHAGFEMQLESDKKDTHSLIIKNPLNFKNKLIYLLRYIFVLVCFEIFNRYIYVNLYLTNPNNSYVLKNEKFNYYSYSLFCFFLLIFIWFKFTVIWRTARIWAMFDDILTEENMNRCMYNNYCFEGFWRAWHRSFNVWLIRYIFIPLGGSSYKFLNVWIVFTFVALWHDLQLKLLLWGWFICFFMIPEIFVKKIFNSDKVIIILLVAFIITFFLLLLFI